MRRGHLGAAAAPARAAGLRRLALLAAAVVLAGASSCEDPCTALRQVPPAHAPDLESIWTRVRTPYDRLWGWPVSFGVVGAVGDVATRPQAVTCGGDRPGIFAAAALEERVVHDGPLGPDVAAFVLAHELSHRVTDLDAAGKARTWTERSRTLADEKLGDLDRADAIEALADKRAAFLVALAGYSPSALDRTAAVDALFQREFAAAPARRAARRGQLHAALERFEDYEWLYELGTSLTFAGEFPVSRPLLDWADRLVQGRSVPLPELRVARALERIGEAAPEAMRRRPGLEALRCEPVYPTVTALVDPARRTVRGERPDPDRLLQESLALLDDAERWGAAPLVVAAGRGCALLYLGRGAESEAALAEAARLAAASPSPVREALERDRALAAAVAGRGASMAAPVPKRAAAPACRGAGREAPAGLELLDARPRRTCPHGWTLARSITAPADDGAVIACRSPDAPGTSLVAITGETPAVALELEPSAAGDLASWACGCALSAEGVSDAGEGAWLARCGPFRAALVASADGRVRRAVVLGDE